MKFRLYKPGVAFRALGRIIWAAITNKPLFVTPKIAAERYMECKKRDGSCYDAVFDQCQVCTCHASVKTLFSTERCPKNHWQRESIETQF